MRAAGELALEEHVVREVERGHVPLHPVQDVVVAVAGDGGADTVDVGPRALLGDGVALAQLPADRWDDPFLHLVVRGDVRQPPGGGVEDPPEGVGHPAGLFLDQDLLEGGEAPAAELLRHVDGVEPELVEPLLVLLDHLRRELAAVHLGLDLVGDQLVGEGPGPLLDVPVLLGKGKAHDLRPARSLTERSV